MALFKFLKRVEVWSKFSEYHEIDKYLEGLKNISEYKDKLKHVTWSIIAFNVDSFSAINISIHLLAINRLL